MNAGSRRGLRKADRELVDATKWQKTNVDLRGYEISEFPIGIFATHFRENLCKLELSHNCLVTLPSDVGQLRSLRFLYLGHNRLKELPLSLALLKNLSVLDVSHNCLHVIPSCLNSIQRLNSLNLSGNDIRLFDAEILRLPHLTRLYITRNPIENVPRHVSVAGLEKLREHFGITPTEVKDSPVRDRAGINVSPTAHLRSHITALCIHPLTGDELVDRSARQAGFLPVLISGGATSDYGTCSGGDHGSDATPSETFHSGFSARPGCAGSANGSGNGDVARESASASSNDEQSDREWSPESGSTLTGGAGTGSFEFTVRWCDRHADGSHASSSGSVSPNGLGHNIAMRSDEDAYFRLQKKTLADHTRVLRYKDVIALIPAHNRNGYIPDEFTLDVIEDLYYTPQLTERSLHASQVVKLGPHGSAFYEDEPALIYLPLGADVVAAADEDDPASRIVCLCSDTPDGSVPDWHPLPSFHYDYLPHENKVVIRAWHFSMFTAIISSPYPCAAKRVSSRVGGRIVVPEVPGVEVLFPSGALSADFEASIKVFYDDEPPYPREERAACGALATPIVLLSPHGCQFRKAVRVRLPLPDCRLMCERFGLDPRRSLTVWCSSTGEGETAHWRQCDIPYEIEDGGEECGGFTISFAVRHFSWYKALWDMLATAVHGAKVGVSYVYPRIRFLMMCQAMMEENSNARTFGLEVICYRSDKKLPETGNYKHRVGGSLKPKFVRPGTIAIRLVSQDFEADTLHGEDPSLTKEEVDFHGMEFEKQFACIYKGEVIQKGVMGKCVVERVAQDHKENIFEFNLTKYNMEGELVMDAADAWSLTATRELASMLNVTSDDNWKIFARHLGFTSHEIRNKLASTMDPFAMMMGAFQARGGTPQEFMQALYRVGRDFRVGEARGSSPDSSDGGGRLNRSNGSGGFRLTTDEEDSFSDGSLAGPSRSSTPNRKRQLPAALATGVGEQNRKTKRRRSDMSDSLSSEYSSIHEESSNRNCKQDLETSELWKMSQFINQNWKSLGRTLSVPEEDLNCIEHAAHKDMRECAYQMLLKWKERFPTKCKYGVLYVALTDSGLNSVARAHCVYHQKTASAGTGGLLTGGTRTF